MKLKDLLKEIFSNGMLETTYGFDYRLNSNYIEMFIDMILDCEEFTDVHEIIVPQTPIFLMDKNKIVNSIKLKMVDGIRFKNKCYLNSIWVTPPIFDPESLKIGKSYVKNDAIITPTIYNEETFEPIKEIRLKWSPEEINPRQRLHQILDDIIDHPEEYSVKLFREIVVCGVFEYDSPQENRPYHIIL